MITIRKANIKADFDSTWNIFKQVISTADTYLYNPNTNKEDFSKYWFGENIQTFVAILDNEIVGTYTLKANKIDLGNHIANGSYMVHPNHQAKGIGKLLCEHSLQIAKADNFIAIQFNSVVSTNLAAVALWQKFGFRIIGTTPKGFRHGTLGLVDTYIMYREL